MRSLWLTGLLSLLLCGSATGQKADDLATTLQKLDSNVLVTDKDGAAELKQLVGNDLRKRLQDSNERETDAWVRIKTKADWEKYRDARIQALESSLGVAFKPTDKPVVHVTNTIKGEGYRIDNLVYEGQPGFWVTGNLYLPAKAPKSVPGILICHSHHSPKWQGELQDMGVLWAHLGCAVLIIDQLGHGERRQHPFIDDKSFAKAYQKSRQDYYFRYNVELQLSLVGQSLTGIMVADMRRGVDVLLAHARADPDKIILLGAVAGGGDPAAVTAALEPRIKAVVPFNFGGPQPETRYPLPENPVRAFNYVGGGDWESTRNLRLSARDGFQPWVIVGSVAPRGLIYAHEFSWDKDHDPVWARLQKIYGFYDAKDQLAFTHGIGTLTGKDPVGSHCNNIGPEHRKLIYTALDRWFKIPAPDKAPETRHTTAELTCWTPDLEKKLKPKKLHELLGAAELPPVEQQRLAVGESWRRALGLENQAVTAAARKVDSRETGSVTVERFFIDGAVPVPVVLLIPANQNGRVPVVIALAQDGKQRFLKERSEAIAGLLDRGIAVCLPDLRGTGETAPGEGRGRGSAATSQSSSELMLGKTVLGQRLLDLERVLDVLAKHEDVNAGRIAIWGESFARANAADATVGVPLELEQPAQAEPMGTLLALLASLRNDSVRVVLGRGGLVSYRSVLDSQFLHVPHDVLIPGALRTGDVPKLLAHVGARQVRLEGLVDGVNRRVSAPAAKKILDPDNNVELREDYSDAKTIVAWFAEQLK